MSDLPKLVRDKIPEIIENSGRKCVTRRLQESERKDFFFKKLQEEATEFFEKPSVQEAADMYEVFLCILRNWNIDFSNVVNHAYDKRQDKGSFDRSIILENVE